MNLETALFYFLCFSIGIWFASYIYNIIYFYSSEPDLLDKACYNKSKSFKESFEDLDQLERITKKQFNTARNKIEYYEKNAQLTKRKYLYYADRIEEGLIRLYLGKFISKKDVFSMLDQPVRIHFTFLLIFCGLVLILFIAFFIQSVIYNFGLYCYLLV